MVDKILSFRNLEYSGSLESIRYFASGKWQYVMELLFEK
jgi:hypothetical protein